MKKKDSLEVFLFIICIVCFFIALGSFASILSDVSQLIFPESMKDTGYGAGYDSVLYVKRGLFTSIPFLILNASISIASFKNAMKLNRHNKELNLTKELKELELEKK